MFKSKETKELEKKMTIRKTIQEMNKQIVKLENAEKTYLGLAKKAKAQGIAQQLSLAVSGLKSTMAQKKRVQEMLLNFEIMNQAKEIALTTSDFLQGMGSLSKDMVKLCDAKEFAQVSKQFEQAMAATEAQGERMSMFLDNSREDFASIANTEATGNVTDDDINKLLSDEISADEGSSSDSDIDKELNNLESKLSDKE